jgi:hypothetical protein
MEVRINLSVSSVIIPWPLWFARFAVDNKLRFHEKKYYDPEILSKVPVNNDCIYPE